MPVPGERRTEYGHEWVWVGSDVLRGHWLATDHTKIQIFPASEGIPDLEVYVPQPGTHREMVLHLEPNAEPTAFLYGAKARQARGH